MPAAPDSAPGPTDVAVAAAVAEPVSAFARDDREAAVALQALAHAPEDKLVAFVGKLIVSKGIDLLVAAWPLVLAAEPRARLVVVGFGAYRSTVERLIDALAEGDLATVAAIAAAGRSAEGASGDGGRLVHLQAFLDSLGEQERADYVSAARTLRERIVLTGRLDHEELVDLLPACEAQIVPSTFPEAFGMVAAEAAACGALPICSDHSGLAEVARALAATVPEAVRPLLAFPVDAGSVRGIADRVLAWLSMGAGERAQTRLALVETVRERWSWEGVARGVVDAAQGHLDALPMPLALADE
jgi:glycosyltransferase involved in cell wall biosynthesis